MKRMAGILWLVAALAAAAMSSADEAVEPKQQPTPRTGVGDVKRPEAGAILRKQDVPPAYLAARDRDTRNVDPFLAEARRRSAGGDADAADPGSWRSTPR